jgi:hypothetical protein
MYVSSRNEKVYNGWPLFKSSQSFFLQLMGSVFWVAWCVGFGWLS